jgi:acetyl esterase/lipase
VARVLGSGGHRTDRSPDVTVHYGPLPDQVIDLRWPAAGARPGPASLVVVVHGGFWRQGYDRAHATPQSVALADAGWVVATMEYRRVSRRGGGWPETFDDVAAALDAVPQLVQSAAAGAGQVVDTERPVLVGHSAGGHLVTWAAARHRLPAGSRWRTSAQPPYARVVALAGVLDLALAHRLGLGAGAVADLLGGAPDEVPQRYAATDPARLGPTGIPTALVHGADDDVVPPEVSQAFAAVSPGTTLRVLEGVEHFELIEPRSAAWPVVLDAVMD